MRPTINLFFSLLLVLAFAFTGCSAPGGLGGGGSDDEGPTEEDRKVQSFLGEWQFVVDGIDVNGAIVYIGQTPEHDAGDWLVGSFGVLEPDGSMRLKESRYRASGGHAYYYYVARISADGTKLSGTYGYSSNYDIVNGTWCAARKGQPFLRATDFVGSWDVGTVDKNGEHNFVWELDGNMLFSRNTDPYYPGNITKMILTGGLTFRVEQKSTSGASAGMSVFTGVRESPTVLSGTYSRQILNGTLTGEWFADKMVPGNG